MARTIATTYSTIETKIAYLQSIAGFYNNGEIEKIIKKLEKLLQLQNKSL